MATKAKKTAAKKTTAKKAASKKAPARKTTAKKATVKSTAKKKATVKTSAKKAVKKAPAKKKVAAKKTAPKKTVKKKATVKTSAKKKATVKTTATKKKAAKKTTAKVAPKKKAATKTTAKKATAKKAAPSKAKATKKTAEKPKPKPKPANVGQAPRKTTLAASIPTPTTVMPKDAPQADADASENVQASKTAKQDFKVNDQIVYPAHGVGKIMSLEKQQVAGIPIELFVINFDQEKMKLRVPTGKAKAAGMRPLSDDKTVKDAIGTLKGRARIKRTMWSRRAQEYDAKINSGDIKLVAEVVRDLYRGEDQPEQSYSERQLFEAALDRMAREVAAVRKVDLGKAIEELEGVLRKKAGAAAAAAAAAAN
ncbi:CarD family transcriptional regulator [Hyphococcus flavus]|uniref:CarD family transcriptional regulator n=1 Tax=Hyphococcus flavus TaxID=1866326 RepID=A0AAE9ZF95_9PROT|nr:CarD family transcriptional regulator [Hyphococcus flavus]WDI31637.1 CarD family transcriptional regulator [Hyphococcus flavus]